MGKESLALLADQIYGDRDPLERFFDGQPYSLVKVNGRYQLKIKLPFIEKKDVDLNKVSDELIIRIGGFKRHILLPRQVASSTSVSAKLDGADLSIAFEP